MDLNYKIILFGNGIYQEIELLDELELKIGTTNACSIRFDKTNFFEDFELNLVKVQSSWRMMCSDNLYIASNGIMKQYSVDLSHGDEVVIKYQNGNAQLFTLSFLIDFDLVEHDYNRQIDISDRKSVTIGGDNTCDIVIHNNFIGNDSIILQINGDKYIIQEKNTQYGVYINGFKSTSQMCTIADYDFFMVGGCQFYIKYGFLYTSVKNVSVNGNIRFVDMVEQSNAMRYPKFQRNTRVRSVIPDEKINILPPKQKPSAPEKNIVATLAPTIIAALLMIMLRSMMNVNGMFVIYSGIMMGMGVVTSIITYINQGKKYKRDIQHREKEYTEYAKKQEEKIINLRAQEKEILSDMYISLDKEIEEVVNFDGRLFEKEKDDSDYLELYLGTGRKKASCEIECKNQEFKDTDDNLLNYPEMLKNEYEYLEDVPITVDLKSINCIGVIGKEEEQYNLLKNFTLDLSIRHFYEDVKLYYIIGEDDISRFEWIRWLKNVRNDSNTIRNFMYDENSKKYMLENLYTDLSIRESLSAENLSLLPNKIVFVYRMQDIEKHPVSQYIKECSKYKYTFIFFNEHQELIPQGCDRFIYANGLEAEILDTNNKQNRERFKYTVVDDKVSAFLAKKMGCIVVDKVNLESTLTNNISLFKLLNIMSVEDLDLSERWANSKVYESMAAPLGVKSGDAIVSLDLNEKHHGPHGLVAGTTGSGKSEILQTYILSMATLFHPYEVGFVIIDFKGGGMVNQFKNLPHLIGSITNIDGREIERSLMSIKAELKKRQEYFAKYNVNHIDAYIKLYKQGKAEQPLPHLILIVDEFAELKSSQPEFMKELISASRIGRSLGVHLILATQKPTGVVDEQIWSNSKFKLCLRVQNKNDSNEVIKSPLAAEITEPGRAYLQVGNNEIFELFQSAYSGADINVDKLGSKKSFKLYQLALNGQRKLLFEQKKEKNNDSQTQLDAIVDYINNYCQEKNIIKLPGICLPSLEEMIDYTFNRVVADVITDVNVCLGVYDDPSNQRQDLFCVNITQNNTFILGSSQYGKTNLLQVIIRGLATQYSPKEVQIYILDFASMILKTYAALNHVGGVITASDDEKVKNFFKMMNEEIEQRKETLSQLGLSSFSAYKDAGYNEMSQIVIMVDNITVLKELYLAQDDPLLPLCREGLAVGISVILTNQQMLGMGYKYLSNFSNRIAFYCNDTNEYSSLFNHCRTQCRNIPGRAIFEMDNQFYEFQSYLGFKGNKEIDRVNEVKSFIQEINSRYRGMRAKPIPEIPDILTENIAENYYVNDNYSTMLGLEYKTVSPVSLDILQMGILGLVGKAGMGRTNFVENIIKSLDKNNDKCPAAVFIFDDYMRKMEYMQKYSITRNYVLEGTKVVEIINAITIVLKERQNNMLKPDAKSYMNSQPYYLVVINDKNVLDIISKDKECLQNFKDILDKYINLKVGIIFSNIDNVSIPFNCNEVMKKIKENKHYVIFDDMSNFKIVDPPMALLKDNRKKLRQGDAYYIKDNAFAKIRTVYVSK